jgi:hypothetical protein
LNTYTNKCALLGLLLRLQGQLALLLPPHNRLLEQSTVQVDRLGRVIVARHRIANQIRVAVRVHNANGRDVHLGRVANGCVRRQHIVQRVQEDAQVRQTGDGAKLNVRIGEGATAPVPGVCVLATLHGHLLDCVRIVGVAAEEQDDAAPERNVGGEIERLAQLFGRLVQIEDDVAQAGAIDERFHAVVEGANLVAIVDTGVEEVFDGEQVVDTEVVGMGERGIGHGLVGGGFLEDVKAVLEGCAAQVETPI